MNEHTKMAVDGISAVTALATLTAWLPPVAAFLSIVWYLIRIIEWWRGRNTKE